MIQSYIPIVAYYGIMIMGILTVCYIISKNPAINRIAESILDRIERSEEE